jgi:hypothetical protein
MRSGHIATASTPVAPLVVRDAASQVRFLPWSSVHDIFWNSIHFASSGDSFVMESMVGISDIPLGLFLAGVIFMGV